VCPVGMDGESGSRLQHHPLVHAAQYSDTHPDRDQNEDADPRQDLDSDSYSNRGQNGDQNEDADQDSMYWSRSVQFNAYGRRDGVSPERHQGVLRRPPGQSAQPRQHEEGLASVWPVQSLGGGRYPSFDPYPDRDQNEDGD